MALSFIVECGTLRRAYEGVPVDQPARIVIEHAGSPEAEGSAKDLFHELDRAIFGLSPDARAIRPVPDDQLRTLIVIVGDDVSDLHPSPLLGVPMLPVLPLSAKTSASKLIQKPLNEENAVFWSASLSEVVPAILACSAATLEVPRVFVSYRQNESAALAVQLFDALSHKGFDVFLDHYRIPPGVNFQKRLTQELGDKSMVVVLESASILKSEWTRYEITTAKACELSLFALALPDGVAVPDIPDSLRMRIEDHDFSGLKFDKTAELNQTKLDEVVSRIRDAHDAGVIARRGATREQLQRSLALHGVNDQSLDPATGTLTVRADQQEYVIWASVRTPDHSDFHLAHGAAVAPVKGVVVALSRLLEEKTLKRIDWLSGVCEVKLFDRGQIDVLARQIKDGTLS